MEEAIENVVMDHAQRQMLDKQGTLSEFVPTLERPFFNIYLCEHFDSVVTKITGCRFIPHEF